MQLHMLKHICETGVSYLRWRRGGQQPQHVDMKEKRREEKRRRRGEKKRKERTLLMSVYKGLEYSKTA